MNRKIPITGAFALAVAGLSSPSFAEFVPTYSALFEKDAPRSTDDPLIVRFPHSHILTQTTSRYDELSLPSSAAVGPHYSDKKHFTKMVSAEGRVSRTIYVAPVRVSSLEVIRDMQSQLMERGWKTVWQCAEKSCGESFSRLKYSWQDKSTLVRGERMEVNRARFVDAVFDAPKAVRYVLLRDDTGPHPKYAGIYVALNAGGTFGDLSDTLDNRVTALVEVVEP